jgi:hypothetical protein
VIDLARSEQNHDPPAGFVFFHAAMRGDDLVEREDLSGWTRIRPCRAERIGGRAFPYKDNEFMLQFQA